MSKVHLTFITDIHIYYWHFSDSNLNKTLLLWQCCYEYCLWNISENTMVHLDRWIWKQVLDNSASALLEFRCVLMFANNFFYNLLLWNQLRLSYSLQKSYGIVLYVFIGEVSPVVSEEERPLPPPAPLQVSSFMCYIWLECLVGASL